jgi:hypothetical protein
MKTKEENKKLLEKILVTLKNQSEVEQSYYNLIKFEEITDSIHGLIEDLVEFEFGANVAEWICWWLYESSTKTIKINEEIYNVEKMEDFIEYLIDNEIKDINK